MSANRNVLRGALFDQLSSASRIAEVSAPVGSGKTTLLRSWIETSGLTDRTAYVSVSGQARDPQRFWLAVVDALRTTTAGSALVGPLHAAPDLDGWAVVEQVLSDLGTLRDRTWLILDDLHELAGTQTLRQLRLLILRAPAELRFVLATRHDLRLGLHRLRLDGEVTEIRASSLHFTLEETSALFEAAGVHMSENAVGLLHRRTEGWAAGLRLAALSLAGHPDPERFAAEFSGSERTVADYLLAEVLEQQPEQVRTLLLRTSVLDRMNGSLADLLTSGSDGEQILLNLEQAGAFVLAVDPQRSWFRYHRLFADLLQHELRRTESARLPALHAAASGWYGANGYTVEAVRHAQAAQRWDDAVHLLSDHWTELYLDGQAGTIQNLLAGFPASAATANAELAVLMAAADLEHGSPQKAERWLALAAGRAGTTPPDRRGHFEVMCTILRLRLARRCGDLSAVAEEVERLLAAVENAETVRPDVDDGLRAMALISLGAAEVSAMRFEGANRHLEQGIALARQISRPYLELAGLAYDAQRAVTRSYTAGAERSSQAIDLARKHGWSDKPLTAIAWSVHADALLHQGRWAEAESSLDLAQRCLRPEVNPVAAVNLRYVRASLALALGEHEAALVIFQEVEQLSSTLVTPHVLQPMVRTCMLHALIRLGKTQSVEQALAEMAPDVRASTPIRTAEAALRLAQADPQGARDLLPSPAADARPGTPPIWAVAASVLEALACDALDLTDEADRALEQALGSAAPDQILFPILLHPVSDLLKRLTAKGTAHHALIREILARLDGDGSATPTATGTVTSAHIREPLSDSEMRVLRYLPTNLSAPEIAAELSLSVNTIRTHTRHVYEKLGAHSRSEAVALARFHGLVANAPSLGGARQQADVN
ncbi:LuxR family maltose regulon positive regulatory protein [Catenulispora sp. GP43]|uniref:LuxR C-terminal-related transcriptional regulator n=1 Tax=Catenulispora sp. GP43 TaxID=3156263 RepID=UPI003513F216